MVKGLIRVVAHIQRVENVPKDLLGQVGKSIAILKFLGSDQNCLELLSNFSFLANSPSWYGFWKKSHKTYKWNYSNNVQVPLALRKKICFTLVGFWTRALPYGYWCRQSTILQNMDQDINAILSSTNDTWGWARFLPETYVIRIWVILNTVYGLSGYCRLVGRWKVCASGLSSYSL